MAPRLVGVDSAAPRLPQTVVTPTQGPAALDVAPGDVGAAYAAKAGATFTGPLILHGPPDTDLEAASKAYVDSTFAGGGVGFVTKSGDTMMGSLRFGAVNLGVYFDADAAGTNRGRLTFTVDRLVAAVADPYAFTVDVGAVERLRIDTAVRVNGGLRATVPADYWSAGATTVFLDGIGFLGTLGSNRVSLVANGYRNASAGWTSLGVAGAVGGAAVEVDPIGAVLLRAQASAIAGTAPAEIARAVSSAFVVGKSTANTWATVAGVELWSSTGFAGFTVDAGSANQYLVHLGTSDANGIHFHRYYRTGSALIGSVSQVATTGVAFNTTSHGPWKAEGDPIGDDEALATIRAYRPVRYQWRLDVNGNPTEAGTPTGPFQRGLIAQEVVDVMAEAVNVGGDNERVDGFHPWGVDYGRITPDLIAAVQALDRRLAALEAA